MMAPENIRPDDPDELLDELAAEFIDRYRAGERPSVAEYADRYSELADEIHDLFPTIAQMEGFKVEVEYENRQHASTQPIGNVAGNLNLTELGDFRIIREIGRGGMGVVYEAEQTSLGRRVAVKVLPLLSLLKPELVQRFEREAKTAGQLHHTNIVPVFGVGEFRGFHYYVMQYIDGIGLDELIADRADTELRGFESQQGDQTEADSDSEVVSPTLQLTLAESLLEKGFFKRPEDETMTSETGIGLVDGSAVSAGDATAPGNLPIELPGGDSSPVTRGAGQRLPLPNVDIQLIARIGLQSARALQYAHQQGTLHRDIKPANLLLDRDGVVWVADFGLAKAIEGDDITQSGNVVGTVRYMAPEQLQGRTDPRSDVYGLGITLYELLTKRRAWQATERSSLIQQVMHGELPSPRKLNSAIPIDLDTIVQKATARDAEQRYSSAAALAEDLEAFLEHRPISARRIGPAERLVRWSRRNPIVAGLSALSIALLVAVAVTASMGYQAEYRQRTRAEQTADKAIATLDQIFEQFDPSYSNVSAGSTLSGNTTGTAPAVVSAETASLLESLLQFYDQLARDADDDPELALKCAQARRRVGDIRKRLGLYEPAIESYGEAQRLFRKLKDDDVISNDRLVITLAELQNEIGASQRMIGEEEQSLASHQKAVELLTRLSTATQTERQVRFELARSHFFQAWRLRPGESVSSDLEDETVPEDERVRPPGRLGPGPRAPFLRHEIEQSLTPSDDEITHFAEAVRLLSNLVNEDSKAPEYRHLLAICLREWHPERLPGSPIEGQPSPEKLLQQLVEDYPNVPEYRHALSETYARFSAAPGTLSDAQFATAEAALDEALRHAKTLNESYPTVPSYRSSLVHIYHKMANLQTEYAHTAGSFDSRREIFDRAERNLRSAIEAQEPLLRQFPQAAAFRLWQARFQRRLGELLHRKNMPDDAIEMLTAARHLTESIEDESDSFDALPRLQERIHLELASIYSEQGDVERELQHVLIAEDYREKIRRRAEFEPPGFRDRLRPGERRRPRFGPQ